MPKFETRRFVRHSPEQMFDLIMDVERYPEFLPLCESLVVIDREMTPGGEVVVADMTIGYKAIRETFRSRVEADASQCLVVARYIDGPIKHLENRWQFALRDGGGCIISFYLNYEFKNLALKVLMGAMFDKAFRKFAEAFEARADMVYGVPQARIPDASVSRT